MHKGVMKTIDTDGSTHLVVVAVKEMRLKDEINSMFYDFQHEVMIMRYHTVPVLS